MTEAEKQQNALDVLKSLNAAVTTTKLYPPSFPQVAKSVEDAFDKTLTFLRNYGELSLGLIDNEPKLCGLTVSQKTLGIIPGKDIFQQLQLLKIKHVVLQRGLTRKIFQQILIFLTTSPQLVNREGGGRTFVASLGLHHIFPEKYSVDLPTVTEDFFAIKYQHYLAEEAVTDGLISLLSEEIDAETVAGQKKISRITDALKDTDTGTTLVLASVASVLKGVYRSGAIFFPLQFEQILKNINKLKAEELKSELASATAKALVNDLDEFALHVLLLQSFPLGYGDELFNQLLLKITTKFDIIIDLIEEEKQIVASNSGKDSGQYLKIASGLDRLLNTEKGKQFLARNKAKKLLEVGEKERQAKRVQAGITAILQGDVNSLKNKEILKHLPVTVESLISKGKDKLAATIIESITTELIKGDTKTHDLLSESLSLIGESLISSGKWTWLEKLSIPIMAWVQAADRADEIYENIINILQKILKYYWKNDKEEKADQILRLFFAIRTGKLKKSNTIKEMVGRVQDRSVEKAPLPRLISRCLEQDDDLADRRLIMQGPIVARFLLNALFSSENMEERMKIIELLGRMGSLLPPLLLEKLSEPMPWHDKRNLIKLLSETGDKEDAYKIFEYLNHDDVRVQKETFSCIYKLSRDDRKNILLKVLSLASGHMREQVVKALTPLADDEVVDEVGRLLDDWQHFSTEIREPLIAQICVLLGRYKSIKSEEVLERFLQNEGKSSGKFLSATIWQTSKSALRQIKAYNREMSKNEIKNAVENEQKPVTKKINKKITQQINARTSFVEETHIENLLVEGEVDKARKILVELIYKASELKRFIEAEKLREWLIEIDPMALADIIRTAEIIEEQKTVSINKDYLQIWSKLYDNLTTEEFNTLYYSMEHKTYGEEVSLVRQEMSRPALFFINNGQVKLFYNDKSSEVLVKVARQGDVLGVDTFFDASIWTINAATLSKADISSLNLKNTSNWKDDFPALESKLHDFCRELHDLDKHLVKSGKSRREYRRYPLAGRVAALILENDGKETGIQVKGELADISSGGISFALRISQKKNARVLLGRNVRVQMSSTAIKEKLFSIEGVLVTVRSLYSMNNEYSAHVKFSNPLADDEMRGIIESGESISK